MVMSFYLQYQSHLVQLSSVIYVLWKLSLPLTLNILGRRHEILWDFSTSLQKAKTKVYINLQLIPFNFEFCLLFCLFWLDYEKNVGIVEKINCDSVTSSWFWHSVDFHLMRAPWVHVEPMRTVLSPYIFLTHELNVKLTNVIWAILASHCQRSQKINCFENPISIDLCSTYWLFLLLSCLLALKPNLMCADLN